MTKQNILIYGMKMKYDDKHTKIMLRHSIILQVFKLKDTSPY
jgi:hypothetical protein